MQYILISLVKISIWSRKHTQHTPQNTLSKRRWVKLLGRDEAHGRDNAADNGPVICCHQPSDKEFSALCFARDCQRQDMVMTQVQATVISITAVISSIGTIIAILVAILVEIRTNRLFSEELRREERLAIANIKPFLVVHPTDFTNRRAVTLHNYGIGTAVMTGISFAKGNKVDSLSLVNLFNFSEDVAWDHIWSFRQRRLYVQPGQDVVLARLTEENLAGQGFDEAQIRKILDAWQEQMDGITIYITYEDILGNLQEDYETTLVA
jgi:hypothetical protein